MKNMTDVNEHKTIPVQPVVLTAARARFSAFTAIYINCQRAFDLNCICQQFTAAIETLVVYTHAHAAGRVSTAYVT